MTAVIDASALLQAFLSADAGPLRRRLANETLHAPDHLFVEAANVLRRQKNAGVLTPAQAGDIYTDLLVIPVRLWPFRTVAERVWELGANATSYDAAYLALAEDLSADLITHDSKLVGVPGVRCNVCCY